MPLNIKITERDNSVYNALSKWANLVNETKTVETERSCETRKVLFEKYSVSTLKRQRKKVLNEWGELGFLKGLHGNVKQNIAELYEAQTSCLLSEVIPTRMIYNIPVGNSNLNQVRRFMNRMSTPVGVSSRGFDSKSKKFFLKIKSFFISIWNKIFKKKNVETNFGGIVFPLIQRVSARTIGLDLVPVQPMSLPSGMLFYLDKKEREDVYTRVVLVEKWKPRIRYSNMTFNQDYYNPIRYDNDNMMILDGPAGR